MSVLQLPLEIQMLILKTLSYNCIANLSQTCKALQNICKIEDLWMHLCERDYGVTTKGGFSTFRKLYQQYLHHYRNLLGVYMTDVPEYGGFAEIYFDQKLTASSIENIRPDSETPINRTILFMIENIPKANGQRVLCCKTKTTHEAQILRKGRTIAFQCLEENRHDAHRGKMFKYQFQHMLYETCFPDGLVFLPLKIPERNDIPESLRTPEGYCPKSLIEPGLYRCINNSDFNDLIIFRYKDEFTLTGFRVVTTNSHGIVKNSVKIYLRRWFIPTAEEQASTEALLDLQVQTNQGPYPLDAPDEDYQVLPHHYVPRALIPELKKCKARYHGYAKIFERQWEDVHLIVFNKGRVGICWVILDDLSIYEKIDYEFTERKVENVKYCNL